MFEFTQIEWLPIAFGALIAGVEIPVDKKVFWDNGLNDKPMSTIARAILFLTFAFICRNWIGFAHNLLLSYSVFFLIFDWALNVTRWSKLEDAYHWKIRHGVAFTKWEKYISWPYKQFTHKFFYHAKPAKYDGNITRLHWFLNNWYELMWTKAPPPMEILIKGGLVLSFIMYF
jgi:hypothetical protein